MNSSDTAAQQKEVIRQESFWFTATTLGFTAFVGTLLSSPSAFDANVASALVVVLWVFTVYLLVGRYRKYRELNQQPASGWWAALATAVKEMSGTLYCIGAVTFSTAGFLIIICQRLCRP
jgi:hypothetical protein